MDKIQAVKFIRYYGGIDSIVECKNLYESNPVLVAVAEAGAELERELSRLQHQTYKKLSEILITRLTVCVNLTSMNVV